VESKVFSSVGEVMWGVWLCADEVRKTNPKYTAQEQWVKDDNGNVPLFTSPEDGLEWILSWIKDKALIRFYRAQEFSRTVKEKDNG